MGLLFAQSLTASVAEMCISNVHSAEILTCRRRVLFALALALSVASCSPGSRAFSIPSSAMEPTLHPGDLLLADELAYVTAQPGDTDIVVFFPPRALGPVPFVKRIVASPGDELSIDHGRLVRNGAVISEPFVNAPTNYSLDVKDYGVRVDGVALDPARAMIPPKAAWQAPDRVPNGYYIVLGDNRNDSDDSHLWGFMRRDQIIGKVYRIYWPPNHYRDL
jgi:signal peptidase I